MSIVVSTLLSDVATLTGDGSLEFQDKLMVGLKQVLRIMPSYLSTDRVLRQATASVAAGNDSFSLPNGTTQISEFYYIKSGETDRNYLKYVPISYMETLYDEDSSGTPEYYTIRGQEVLLEYTIDTTSTFYITANILNVNDVETGDTLDFPPEVIAAIQAGLEWQAYKYMEDSREKTALATFTELLKLAEREYTQRVVGTNIVNSGRY